MNDAILFFENIVNEEVVRINDCEEKESFINNKISKNKKKLGNIFQLYSDFLPIKAKRIISSAIRSGDFNENDYFISWFQKKVSLDFLQYVLKNDPVMPLEYFNYFDYKEIKKFIRNKFLLAIFDKIPKNHLFDKEDLLKQAYYLKITDKNKITKRKNHYEYLGFKSFENCFEDSVLIERYGISYLKDKRKIIESVVIDCGAFNGDSTYVLNKELRPQKIIAIEPEITNYKNLIENIRLNNMGNIIPIQKGIGEKREKLFIKPNGIGAHLAEIKSNKKEEYVVEVTTLDSIVLDLNFKKIGLIKMDIEGYELAAIKGSVEIIKKFKPVLIISLYHRGQDFFEIPAFIKRLAPEYAFRFVNINAFNPIAERVLIGEPL